MEDVAAAAGSGRRLLEEESGDHGDEGGGQTESEASGAVTAVSLAAQHVSSWGENNSTTLQYNCFSTSCVWILCLSGTLYYKLQEVFKLYLSNFHTGRYDVYDI